MENDLNILANGRRPQYFETLTFWLAPASTELGTAQPQLVYCFFFTIVLAVLE
jgi:hypothetical protein